jgi:hypothetical protein
VDRALAAAEHREHADVEQLRLVGFVRLADHTLDQQQA